MECLSVVVSQLKKRRKWVNFLALRLSPSSDERSGWFLRWALNVVSCWDTDSLLGS